MKLKIENGILVANGQQEVGFSPSVVGNYLDFLKKMLCIKKTLITNFVFDFKRINNFGWNLLKLVEETMKLEVQ